MNYTESDFESHIEKGLNQRGFQSLLSSTYDQELCLITTELIQFVKESQPKKWERLSDFYGSDTESKFVKIVSDEIRKKGVIDVLRGSIKHRGLHFELVYFEPKSGLNPDHQFLYKQNRFTVVRQLYYSTKNENSIDMVLFLNGIPLLTMELKNQLTGQTIENSEKQYRKNRNPKGEPLLQFKRCVVHFCVDNDQISMTTRLSGDRTRFLPFNKGIENPVNPDGFKTHYLWEEILTPTSLLDILENFVHISIETEKVYNSKTDQVEEKDSTVLIFPRYHQLEVIRNLRESLIQDGVGKNYLIQHTTGSGKSYEIGWLSHMLTSLYRTKEDTNRIFDTVIILTDRRVLDRQLQNTVKQLERTSGVVSGVDKTSEQLRDFLEKGKSIVISTIQKFPVISDSIKEIKGNTFGVIVDEVHSSQSGESRRHLNKVLSTGMEDHYDDELDLDDFDERILSEMKNRGQQSHVTFFGFTGTPKTKTIELFGTKGSDGVPRSFHTYSMKQSITEGFTLDVLQNYTTYKRHFELSKRILEDPLFPERTSSKQLLSWVDLHDHNVKEKVEIILDHFINHTMKKIGGKGRGMVIVKSRKLCVKFRQEMDRQLKEMGTPFEVLVGFSGTVHLDGMDYTETSMNPGVRSIPDSFKLPKYRILIVSNKFQTGYDEPLLHTMYVDKKLGGIQCVQSLSRLNRTCPGKTDTLVIDFVNNEEDVVRHFQPYFTETEIEGTTDPNRLYDLQNDIESFHLFTNDERDEFCKIFLDPSLPDEKIFPILDRIVERWNNIEDEEKQEDFRGKCSSFVRLYGYISQLVDFFETEWEKLYMLLRSLIKKLPRPDRVDIHGLLKSVDLEYFRLEKQYEGSPSDQLIDDVGVLPQIQVGVGRVEEEEEDYLSSILSRVNEVYGIDFTEEDKVTVEQFRERVFSNPEIDSVHNSNNSPTNKRKKFMEKGDEVLLDFVNTRLEFYNKLEKNPDLKKMLMGLLYEDYLDQKGYSRV